MFFEKAKSYLLPLSSVIKTMTEELKHRSEVFLDIVKGGIVPEEFKRLSEVCHVIAADTSLEEDRVHKAFDIATIIHDEMELGIASINCSLLYETGLMDKVQMDPHNQLILEGLEKVKELYSKSAAIETENFRKLLLTFAQDIRVVLIMVAERLWVMRNLKAYSEKEQVKIATETGYLYTPLVHRMGLYAIKSEFEDLALKFTNREVYSEIASKLRDTKRSREEYIANFIAPIKETLDKEGFKFEIKGRTKTIYSILNKIQKQKTDFEDIYDLFAIRIILDSKEKNEKSDCWRTYSVVTDMYQPNPKRLRDWLSIPKSNGYESLHTTVMGPDGKWVEVQIRTQRMNEVAEKGLAAHWRYKGVKSEKGLDDLMTGIREILENPEMNAVDFMDEFRLGLYEKEVFVFTPKGDLRKLKRGATVLDFAFEIHSKVGAQCVGASINGKNVSIRHVLQNGDQVVISTSASQSPKQGWLKVVTTSKAKNKINQALREAKNKEAELGRELLIRRFKNWKLPADEGVLHKLVSKMRYSTDTEFFYDIQVGVLETAAVRDLYNEMMDDTATEEEQAQIEEKRKAINYVHQNSDDDVLTIDGKLQGVDYSLGKCCHPVIGDEIFGFLTSSGGLKIHRKSCPNAMDMISRYGYRVVEAKWEGENAKRSEVLLNVTGVDNIGIITNISQVLSRESKIKVRSMNIDSEDGFFNGEISIFVNDTTALKFVLKKIKEIKGVKRLDILKR